MKTIEHRFIDKSTWADGPWHHEPDKRQWQDSATGLYCLVLRNKLTGNLCGYVGLPPEHPAHGLHYDGVTSEEAEARMKAFRANTRRWAQAGYPPLDQWWKRNPTPDRDDTPFPGVGELLAAIEVHGGLTYADTGNTAIEANWHKLRKSLRSPKTIMAARKYPVGDAARWRREWLPVSEDLAAYQAKIQREYLITDMEPGEPTDLWFFGFDCGHAWDVMPGMDAMSEEIGSRFHELRQHRIGDIPVVYRDLAYVEEQIQQLAVQLHALTVMATALVRPRIRRPT